MIWSTDRHTHLLTELLPDRQAVHATLSHYFWLFFYKFPSQMSLNAMVALLSTSSATRRLSKTWFERTWCEAIIQHNSNVFKSAPAGHHLSGENTHNPLQMKEAAFHPRAGCAQHHHTRRSRPLSPPQHSQGDEWPFPSPCPGSAGGKHINKQCRFLPKA